MQTRANGADRAADNCGSFFVAHVLQFAKDHGFAKLVGQFENGGTDLSAAFALFGPHGGGYGVFQDHARAGAVFVFFFERDFSRQTLAIFQNAITRHAIQKGRYGAEPGVIFLRIANQRHKYVLYNFFSSPGATGHSQSETVDRRLVATIYQGKGFLITLGGPAQQNVVCSVLKDGHLLYIRRLVRLLGVYSGTLPE